MVDYDPTWPAAFARIAGAVRASLGDTAIVIEHVGSTSVPGLAAKPVIDVDLTRRAMRSFTANAIIAMMNCGVSGSIEVPRQCPGNGARSMTVTSA